MATQPGSSGVGDASTSRTRSRRSFSRQLRSGTLGVAIGCSLLSGSAGALSKQGESPDQVRRFIDQQVGGLENLMVPAENADLPQPMLPDGTPDPFFRTTEEKRYLGKLLFHDPIRTARILPEFGGVPETARTASCGSCHFGAAASKAGTLFNFAVGGEGVGFTNAHGDFVPRRRPRVDLLPQVRQTPLFQGDALVDELPTLTDIYRFAIGSPALGQLDGVGELLRTGRLDALDSVGRNAPSVIGAAFNNRLLLDGFAGEPDETPGGLNPFGHPAQENVTLLLLDAHRMLDFQSAELQQIPAYVKLFRDAFPEEAAQADAAADPNLLINDVTVFRATASFIRTVVTRNTPWDRFLAGDDHALTPAQLRGAKLFFTDAAGGAGGAGCYSCHSGPMLNKQPDDPDVAGVGELLEENFYNLGLADHPLQALNREARMDPTFRDEGRKEITGREGDAFEFRVLTLRQLRDGRFFMHNGAFSRVRDVVRYFNAGIPQDATAAAASSLTSRFTNPRGPGFPAGLGLHSRAVRDLTDFLENALYDPAFVTFDPSSTTDSFQASERDLTYSAYRPDLAALGAVDGRMPSGLPQDNDDPLSRRDVGLEFLDVTSRLDIDLEDSNSSNGGNRQVDTYEITNDGTSVVDTHLVFVVRGLPDGVRLTNAHGVTSAGEPFRRAILHEGVLLPGESIEQTLRFRRDSGDGHGPGDGHGGGPGHGGGDVTYALVVLSGQGQP